MDDAWLDGTAVLHVPAYGFAGPASAAAALLDAASRVRDHGGAVTFDASAVTLIAHLGPDRVHRIIAELSPAIVFANAAEARALELVGRPPLPDRVYVVKDGPNPAAIVAGGRTDHVPAHVVAAARDTTGAGDAFAAAASWPRGWVADRCATPSRPATTWPPPCSPSPGRGSAHLVERRAQPPTSVTSSSSAASRTTSSPAASRRIDSAVTGTSTVGTTPVPSMMISPAGVDRTADGHLDEDRLGHEELLDAAAAARRSGTRRPPSARSSRVMS